MQQQPDPLLSLIPLIVMGLISATLCYILAAKKGYKPWKAVILGLIPGIGFIFLQFYIGAPDLILRRRIDELLGTEHSPGE